jgi:hypothetical protein
VGGLDMGILSDGTPFLSGRAFALLCEVYHGGLYLGRRMDDTPVLSLLAEDFVL